MRRAARAAVLLAVALALAAPRAWPDGPAPGPPPPPTVPPTVPKDEIAIREALWVPPVGVSRREPTHTDAIEASIVAGTWTPPKAGDKVTLPNGTTKEWTSATANDKGWFEGTNLQGGGYLFARVASDTERVAMLHGVGHDMVYANGELRPGDPYGYGWLRLPVLLKKGGNDFLFRVSRGRMTATLAPPPAPVFLMTDDSTIANSGADPRGAAVVINASTDATSGWEVIAGRLAPRATPIASIPALSVRRVAFALPTSAPDVTGEGGLWLRVRRARDAASGSFAHTATLAAPKGGGLEIHTYTSSIDGSLQYYAVNPARPSATGGSPPALILSLHGAGVEASGQAAAYAPKSWATIVAPTNRRPYGFDWEDWGRTDAREVMAHALASRWLDPSRIFLTGHSMGGHGTWQVAAHFPEFAAIGPSAGWSSFASYVGGPGAPPNSEVERMLRRAASPSDTLALASNFARMGVYVLHGDADDNVPVTEARRMVEVLKGFHHDFRFHEQKGAGHWWDVSDEPGADCVDWAPMMDFFARHRIPADEEVREIDFATCDPGVSDRCGWLEVGTQDRARETSRVRLRCDPGKRRIVGTTENVARLSIGPGPLDGSKGLPVSLELDGAKISDAPWVPSGSGWRIGLEKRAEGWILAAEPSHDRKGPHRCGPFKAAFGHGFTLVYGTQGTSEENAAVLAKARYDAEAWYYRANGSIDVVPDTEFDPQAETNRSVILYGNADTNAAWAPLLENSLVQVRRGSVQIGARKIEGDDLACLFVRPRPESDTASVGVVAGTGLPGLRLTERLPYFTSGVHYPDVTVIGAEMLSRGVEGVRVAGFFGNDWGVDSGEFAWRDKP